MRAQSAECRADLLGAATNLVTYGYLRRYQRFRFNRACCKVGFRIFIRTFLVHIFVIAMHAGNFGLTKYMVFKNISIPLRILRKKRAYAHTPNVSTLCEVYWSTNGIRIPFNSSK